MRIFVIWLAAVTIGTSALPAAAEGNVSSTKRSSANRKPVRFTLADLKRSDSHSRFVTELSGGTVCTRYTIDRDTEHVNTGEWELKCASVNDLVVDPGDPYPRNDGCYFKCRDGSIDCFSEAGGGANRPEDNFPLATTRQLKLGSFLFQVPVSSSVQRRGVACEQVLDALRGRNPSPAPRGGRSVGVGSSAEPKK